MRDRIEVRQLAHARDFGLLTLLTIALIVVTRAVALLSDYDPWIDEAMLLANLPLPLDVLFHPLPLYEQAAPLGYLLLANAAIWVWPGDDFDALRLLSVVTNLAGLTALGLAVYRSGLRQCVPLVLAIAGLTPFAIRYAVEAKQYGAEFASVCFLLLACVSLIERRTIARYAWFSASALGVLLFSFVAPLLLCAAVATILLHLVTVDKVPIRDLAGMIAFLAAVVLMGACWHFLVSRPLTATQLAAYGYLYSRSTLRLPLINPEGAVSLNYFVGLVLAFLDPALTFNSGYGASKIVELIGLALATLGGLWLFRRKRPFFPGFAVLSLAAWAALSASGIAPSAYNRHFMALVPVMSILCSAGASYFLLVTTRSRLVTTLCAAIVLALGAVGTKAAFNQEKQPLSQLFKYIETHGKGEPTLWMNPTTWPAGLLIASGFGRQIGKVAPQSSTEAWFKRALTPAYTDGLKAELEPVDELWLLFTLDDSHQRWLAFFEENLGPCHKRMEYGSNHNIGRTTLYLCSRPRP